MIVKVIIVLLSIGAVRNEFKCSANDNCLETGCLYPNPKDCRTFYQCDLWGNAYLKHCPPYTGFNERIRVCDWPSQIAGCIPYTTNKPSSTGTPSSTIRSTTLEISIQTATPTETPTKVSNNEPTYVPTNEPTDAPTDAPTSKESVSSTSGPVNPGFVCPVSDIANTGCKGPKDCLYPNPDNCNSFIQCLPQPDGTGSPVVMLCPAGLEWNDNYKICDWPSSSTCNTIPD